MTANTSLTSMISNLNGRYALQTPTHVGFKVYLLMVVFSVFYLYRVAIFGFNFSMFRIVFIAALIFTIAEILSGRIRIRRTHLILYFFIISDLGISALDALRSREHPLMLRVIGGHVVSMGVLWVSAMQLDSENKILIAIKWFVLASVVPIAITIYTTVTGHMPFPQLVPNLAGTDISLTDLSAKFLGVIPRATAAFYDPTFYGSYICVCLCFAVFYLTWVARSRVIKLLIILNSLMLVATLSRTSWIGALVLLVLTFIFIARTRLRVMALGLLLSIGVIGLILVLGISSPWNYEKLTQVGSLKSVASREVNWDAGSLEFVASPILGGGSAKLSGMLGGGPPSAHIVYLSWLAKYGLLGFLLYSAFFFYPIIYAMRKHALSLPYRFLILGVLMPMAVMYFGYDFFNQLDVEYLAFGFIYAVVINRLGLIHTTALKSQYLAEAHSSLH